MNFTKMQGAGNDFVVLDETRTLLNLTAQDYQRLGDRHFGVGADQILSVRAASTPDVDFDYVIHNNDGGEVEHCGNGARCFVRFVRSQGLTDKTTIKVRTHNRVLTLSENANGQVTVDMGAPIFDAAQIPYAPPREKPDWDYVLSMGNPHAVCLVDDVEATPVLTRGPMLQANAAFPNSVNVAFMQIVNRTEIKLRVYERGAGETLACGTGACAAVVAGIELGLLARTVLVRTHGGDLTIAWDNSQTNAPVMMTGPATTVYQGTIEL
ncbi:MAG: diaminopimelate epimerase [Cytophagales bacterium]|nr:diaminopimelate epimerase [Cytophagales bacterium]